MSANAALIAQAPDLLEENQNLRAESAKKDAAFQAMLEALISMTEDPIIARCYPEARSAIQLAKEAVK